MAITISTGEPIGPQARLDAELFRLRSQRGERWIVVAFLLGVLVLGVLSFLVPLSFWRFNSLDLKVSPQIFFAFVMFLVVAVLFMLRRERLIQELRLQSFRQTLAAQMESSASMLDPLTNVFNRKVLPDLLQREIARAERNNRPLALVVCDLNNFKSLNDRYGHLMGDYVLSQFASTLKLCVRGSDHIVRYGGDEFLVVLPETDEAGVEAVKNRIQTKLADLDHEHRFEDLDLSVSLGVFMHVTGQSADQDVAEADARMYAQKRKFHAEARGKT